MSFQCRMANHYHTCCYAYCPLHLFEKDYTDKWSRCRYRTSVANVQLGADASL